MNLKLELFHLKELQRNSITLDMAFVLALAEQGHILSEICKGDYKMEIIHAGLLRKGLITTDNKITLPGKNILKFLKEEAPKDKIIKKKPDASEFERWWAVFPGTDIFTHKNKKFVGTRSLKRDKDNCRLKFNSILAEGDYTADDLIQALQYDVNNKKDNSVKDGENKLKYLQNSLTYLTQRSFEPFIEIIKSEQVSSESINQGGVDI